MNRTKYRMTVPTLCNGFDFTHCAPGELYAHISGSATGQPLGWLVRPQPGAFALLLACAHSVVPVAYFATAQQAQAFAQQHTTPEQLRAYAIPAGGGLAPHLRPLGQLLGALLPGAVVRSVTYPGSALGGTGGAAVRVQLPQGGTPAQRREARATVAQVLRLAAAGPQPLPALPVFVVPGPLPHRAQHLLP